MENFTIASNSDNRIEAFYIDKTGTVMHTWQKSPDTPTQWTPGNALYGTSGIGGTNNPLTNALRVECCTDTSGQIHVVAFTKDGKYFTCYQSPGYWNGWFEIKQS